MTALVVGGTGMLAGATRWVAARHDPTVLVSRHARRFVADEPADHGYLPVDLDWHDRDFVVTVGEVLADLPPVETCLLWLHRPEETIGPLAALVRPTRTVLVLATTQTQVGERARAAGTTTVQLGSVVEAGVRRWLTHDEISAAAVGALADHRDRAVGDPVPAEE